MSHFYAQIPHSARKTTATARGHKNTGVTTQAASWQGCVTTELYHCTKTGKDMFIVRQEKWHGAGVSEIIAKGVVGELAPLNDGVDYSNDY